MQNVVSPFCKPLGRSKHFNLTPIPSLRNSIPMCILKIIEYMCQQNDLNKNIHRSFTDNSLKFKQSECFSINKLWHIHIMD